ncbi:MAG: tetratricopeptide repeat protein [Pirellulales bacterium]|nr:tetratricopeptide repeat protein [Pirellulales bacterium]
MSAKNSARTRDKRLGVAPATAETWSFVPPHWHGRLGALAILVLAIIAHAAAFPGGLIWEDHELIAQNRHVNTPEGIVGIWTATDQPDYWPVDYTILWLQYRVWGPWATGYRIVNLAGHVGSAVLLWYLLKRLKVPAPWLCGAVFAVHPTTVESVAWCTQSKTIFAVFFALASLACYLRAVEIPDAQTGPGKFRLLLNRWYAAAAFLFLLAMLSKSSVVMWPLILLVVRWWQHRKITWVDVASTIPFLLIAAACGMIARWFQVNVSIGSDASLIRDDGLLSRVVLAGRVIWFYIGKDLLPIRLALVYPRFPLGVQSIWTFVPDAALLVIAGAAWYWRATWGAAVLAAGAYVVINLAPSLGLVNIYFMRFSLVSDHWQYIALPGIVALVIGGSAALLRHFQIAPTHGKVAAALVLVYLIALSIPYAAVYGAPDSEQLWLGVLEQSPDSWLGHHELARVYANRGDHHRAAQLFLESLQLNPEHALSASNLGLQYIMLNRHAEAVPVLRRSVELDPLRSDPNFFLAVALLESGQSASAIEQMKHNVQQFPGDLRSVELLTLTLATIADSALRNGPAAVSIGEQLCALSPSPPASHLHALATAYAEVGRFDEARRTATLALERANLEGNTKLAALISQRLRLFREGRPARVGH